MPKNNITTQGYFVRRLRESGYYVSRVYDRYREEDSRRWTVVISPSNASVFVTCHNNITEWPYKGLYELDDSGHKVPRGYHVNTDSIDVIIKHLREFDVPVEGTINNLNGRRKRSSEALSQEGSTETSSKKSSKKDKQQA